MLGIEGTGNQTLLSMFPPSFFLVELILMFNSLVFWLNPQ